MKILVTGVAGFIGSNLTSLVMQESRHSIVGIDKLTYAANRSTADSLQSTPGHSFHQADICDIEAIRKIVDNEQPHAVLHLAAETHVDRSIDGPDEFIRTNIVGTYRLLKLLREYYTTLDPTNQQIFRFVHISTDEVFGSLQLGDSEFDEQSHYQPSSPYSASKAASDHLARAWNITFGLPVLVTNSSNNYGPWQFPEKLIPVVITNAVRFQPIPVYGNGMNIRDWLHVRDHALALLTLLERGEPGQSYNLGGNNELSNIDLVKKICAILDRLRPISADATAAKTVNSYSDLIEFVEDRPGHDFRYAIDYSKINKKLDWTPQQDLDAGLESTVRWYLDHLDWCQEMVSVTSVDAESARIRPRGH